MTEQRLAIINYDNCKPTKCNKECRKICPVNKVGKICIEIEKTAKINNDLCIGCGMCVKVCPFGAVQIVKLPSEIKSNMLHTYGDNSFRLYKIPVPKIGRITGIIGANGVGKSTLLSILNGQIKPNFGIQSNSGSNQSNNGDIIKGTELQKYFKKLYNGELRIKTKPQNVESIQKSLSKTNRNVKELIDKNYDSDNEFHRQVVQDLEIDKLYSSNVSTLSGGEMQRLVCAIIMLQKADVYIFDEFTNFLDIEQRLKVANLIQKLSDPDKYIFIVEHDMSILDYASDVVSIIYGQAAAYGVVSLPHATPDAINMYFSGYITSENVKFRTESFSFKENLTVQYEEAINTGLNLEYDDNDINFDNFKLTIQSGKIPSCSSIILLLGKNGTGKTTYLNHLANTLGFTVSYKKQYIDFDETDDVNTVQAFLYKNIKEAMVSPLFMSDVIKTLNIPAIYDRHINELSGGERQKVAIALCLGDLSADVYLIDEPSASLDVEQRVIITRVIKRFLLHNKKIGFIVEHDIMMALSLGLELNSQIIVFSHTGQSNMANTIRESIAKSPQPFHLGINTFLKEIGITFRSDFKYKRPRINKLNSQKDKEQKALNKYYF
ncbi:MAG: ribosome biogenesis/translation initiation ATPase RLI [Rickettsia endosymbiont of Ixodes persulcatus]|nr:ribosome biogenesis/translation initiation ATPase RLI [Rickettsia endosymbiont of Ixodes persulcatus]